jgi:hypothetical protein
VYYIYCRSEGSSSSSSLSDVDRYVIIRNILNFIFNILSLFIRRWEIQTYVHRTFHPQGFQHNVRRIMVHAVDRLPTCKCSKVSKVKISLFQAMEAHRVARG